MFLAQCFFPISHDGPQILVIKKRVVSLPHSQGRSIASERPKRFQRLGSLSCSAEKPPPLSRICVYIYIYSFFYVLFLFIYTYIHTEYRYIRYIYTCTSYIYIYVYFHYQVYTSLGFKASNSMYTIVFLSANR